MLCVRVGKLRYGKDGSNMFWDIAVSISDGKPVCWDAVLFLREDEEFDDEDDDEDEDEDAAFRFWALVRFWEEEFEEDEDEEDEF